MEIKLSEVPCEVKDHHTRDGEFGIRVAGVLKQISFPDRDRHIISVTKGDWLSTSYVLKMYVEVKDIRNGSPMALSHERLIKESMSDKELAQELLILMAQFVTHEFLENFRFEGKVLCDPHDTGRNSAIFDGIEKAVKHEPKPTSPFGYTVEFVVVPMPESAPVPFKRVKLQSQERVDVPDMPQKEMTPLEKAREKKKKSSEYFAQFSASKHDTANWRGKRTA